STESIGSAAVRNSFSSAITFLIDARMSSIEGSRPGVCITCEDSFIGATESRPTRELTPLWRSLRGRRRCRSCRLRRHLDRRWRRSIDPRRIDLRRDYRICRHFLGRYGASGDGRMARIAGPVVPVICDVAVVAKRIVERPAVETEVLRLGLTHRVQQL